MLRWIVLALLVANALFFSWSRGWLAPLGYAPQSERDTTRWEQQIRPDLLHVLSSAEAAAALGNARPAATPALVCLESEPLAATAVDAAEQSLAAVLPERGWIRATRDTPAQWAVVIGPLPVRDALQKKAEELGRLRIAHETLKLPGDVGTGLSLGRFDNQAAAQAALDSLARRNVRTARVLRLHDASTELRLRLENATPEQADVLRALKAAALGPQGMQPCAAGSAVVATPASSLPR